MDGRHLCERHGLDERGRALDGAIGTARGGSFTE